jgi:AcrR family transcriptional regulator
VNAFTRTGASRADQKQATRARILDVARQHLERSGFEGTSIRGIAGEAGVAAGTVLLHFKDKHDLLHAALFEDLERTWEAARDAAGRKRTLEGELGALADAFFAYYAKRPALSRTLLRESLFATPPWSERFAAQVASVHAHVAGLAAAARARGALREDADPALFGAAFFSFYYFALIAWLQGGHPDPSRLFRRMLAQHLDGLRTEKETR